MGPAVWLGNQVELTSLIEEGVKAEALRLAAPSAEAGRSSALTLPAEVGEKVVSTPEVSPRSWCHVHPTNIGGRARLPGSSARTEGTSGSSSSAQDTALESNADDVALDKHARDLLYSTARAYAREGVMQPTADEVLYRSVAIVYKAHQKILGLWSDLNRGAPEPAATSPSPKIAPKPAPPRRPSGLIQMMPPEEHRRGLQSAQALVALDRSRGATEPAVPSPPVPTAEIGSYSLSAEVRERIAQNRCQALWRQEKKRQDKIQDIR